MIGQAANNRYTIKTVACFAAYLAIDAAAEGGAFKDLAGLELWAFGILVAAPIAVHVWITLSFLQNMDEFSRALSAKRFVIAWGICMVIFSAAGFMTSYAGLPPVPGQLLYLAFWAAVGLVSLFVHSSR